MTIRVVVHQRQIDNLLHSPSGPIGQRLDRAGLKVESNSKRRCPVDKGRLRSSITATRPFNRGNALVVRIGTSVRYARFVHEGTRFMRGRPFLREGLNMSRI